MSEREEQEPLPLDPTQPGDAWRIVLSELMSGKADQKQVDALWAVIHDSYAGAEGIGPGMLNNRKLLEERAPTKLIDFINPFRWWKHASEESASRAIVVFRQLVVLALVVFGAWAVWDYFRAEAEHRRTLEQLEVQQTYDEKRQADALEELVRDVDPLLPDTLADSLGVGDGAPR